MMNQLVIDIVPLLVVIRNPEVVQFAYTPDSVWRNRDTFIQGRAEIVEFLRKKWSRENGYRLRKQLFAFTDNKVCSCLISPEPDKRVLGTEGVLAYPYLSTWLTAFQIAVQFWYEWYDTTGQWWRTYGLEDWTFAENGLMKRRQMSGNDVKITEEERWFKEGVDVNEVDVEDDWPCSAKHREDSGGEAAESCAFCHQVGTEHGAGCRVGASNILS